MIDELVKRYEERWGFTMPMDRIKPEHHASLKHILEFVLERGDDVSPLQILIDLKIEEDPLTLYGRKYGVGVRWTPHFHGNREYDKVREVMREALQNDERLTEEEIIERADVDPYKGLEPGDRV